MGVATFIAIKTSDISLIQIPEILRDFIEKRHAYGALVYIIVYALRPLIFFPATILTASSGLIFGPLGGIAYTIVGENLSAGLAFYLARTLGRDWFSEFQSTVAPLRKFDQHLRQNGFFTVLVLRLIFMPFDAVNFGCGLTGMRYSEYATATFLGILPGIITFVYFGSSWFAPKNLIISAAVFILSITISQIIRKSRKTRDILR